MTNEVTVTISGLQFAKHPRFSYLPPASRTRYLAPGLKHVTALAADLPPSLSTGRYLQNREAASGSRARDKRSLGMPPWRKNISNSAHYIHVIKKSFER